MATPEKFYVGQGFHQPFDVHDKNALSEQPISELFAAMRGAEVGWLTVEERRVWNPLKEKSTSVLKKLRNTYEIWTQSEKDDDAVNFSAGLLTHMALEAICAPIISEMEQFSQKNHMPFNEAHYNNSVSKFAISMPVGPLSIVEFLKSGGNESMVQQALRMLINAQVEDELYDDNYKSVMTFYAGKIVKAGMSAARVEEFHYGTDSRLPQSMGIREIKKRFVDNIKKTQTNTRAALLNPDDEEIKNEFARLFDCEDASVLVFHVLGFDDGPEALLFHKQIQKVARETGKNTEFYGMLSEYMLEYVERNDPDSLCILEDIVNDISEGKGETVDAHIEEADFENAFVAISNSKTPVQEVIRPQDFFDVPGPKDITFTSNSEAVVVNLVWEIGQGTHKVAIRLDRKAQAIDWSILNDIDSLGVGPAREAILSYLLAAFNLTADSVRPKKVEEQQVVVPQRVEDIAVKRERVNTEQDPVHPKVKLDCPIHIDPIKVEALILASNIRKIHRQKVLAALEAWNTGKGRMLSRVDDKTLRLHVGKVSVSLQEEDGALSIMEISYSK